MNADPAIPGSVEICAVIIILLICGLFTAAQKAIADVNRNAIKSMADDGDKRAKKLSKLLEKSSKLMVTNFVIITFLGLFACQFAAVNHAGQIYSFLEGYNVPFLEILSVLVLAFLSSIVFLVFALFIPRQIGRQHAQGVALKLCGYASVMVIIFKPLSSIVNVLTNIFLKLARQKTGIYEEVFSEENVKTMLEKGQETGAIKEEGKRMIDSVFAFDDKLAYEIMTPRTDVFAIDIQDEAEKYLDELMEMRYSRIPIYDGESDNIIGILNIKDFMIQAREKGFKDVDIRSILREAFFVPETKNIDALFFELQKTKQHIAILIDEYGGFSGIVTMEDIIEEVMGEIDDEYDEEEEEIKTLGENKYLLDGYMNIDDINEELGTNLQSETSETLGGLIIDTLGEIPEEDTLERICVNYENYEFEVINVKDRRIERVVMTIKPKEEVEKDKDKEKDKEKEAE